MVNYVVANIEFHNLPPKLGILAWHHPADKIWKQVTGDVVYVYYKNETILLGKSDINQFDKFCRDNLVHTLVHTTADQVHPYNALCHTINIHKQYTLTSILCTSGIANNFKSHFLKCDCWIEDYLQQVAPLIHNRKWPMIVPKLLETALMPASKAEQLHCKYNHLPDPVAWIRSGYETDEVNEYTEFMSRFDFSRYKGSDFGKAFELVKSITY